MTWSGMARRSQPETRISAGPPEIGTRLWSQRARCQCLQVPTTAARRSGPREHGRQAARSKRSRTERAGEEDDELSHVRAAAAGALIH